MKIFIGILIGLLVVVVVLMIAAPRLIFNFIFGVPSRSTKIPKYYVDTPHYKVSRAGMAILKELPYEDCYITSRDGLKLHAYLFPAEEGTGNGKFLIGIHGYRSYSRPEFGPYVEFYRSLGYSMLLPDDRAHRPSEGEHIGFGVLDRLDCVDWAKYVVDRFGDDVEILLHGVSMGGATVCAASGEPDLPSQVKGIVSDCAFSSAESIIAHQKVPGFLIPKIEKICEKEAGFNFHEHTALQQVAKAKVPMLFVQGEKDEMVPSFMATELYEACSSENKRLLLVPEAGHGESIAFAPEEYHNAIIEMFE